MVRVCTSGTYISVVAVLNPTTSSSSEMRSPREGARQAKDSVLVTFGSDVVLDETSPICHDGRLVRLPTPRKVYVTVEEVPQTGGVIVVWFCCCPWAYANVHVPPGTVPDVVRALTPRNLTATEDPRCELNSAYV